MGDIVAVITARGGSVRIPRKNIRLLGGKPLIEWSIKAALQSKCTRVIVSTDCEQIRDFSIKAGAEVPFKRPLDISKNIPSHLVTQHAIKFHENQKKCKVHLAVTIQPTTPFLSTKNINDAISMIEKNNFMDSVFTAGPVKQRPEYMFQLNKDTNIANNQFNKKLKGEITVSQNLTELWHPNGGAYVTKRETLFEYGSLIGKNPGILKMSDLNSIDIDEEIDFIFANSVLEFLNK